MVCFLQYPLAQLTRAVEYMSISLQRGNPPQPNEYPGYDIKQSDGEVPVMLWGNTEYLFIFITPGPLWPGVVAPDRFLSMGQIEVFDI